MNLFLYTIGMQAGNKAERFLLVTIIPQRLKEQDALRDLLELKSLVEAYGGEVNDLIVQHREVHDKGMYIGTGKILEIANIVKQEGIDVVILNAIVKPGHIYEIKSMLEKVNKNIQVWDRIDLILQIFSKHAHTAEARLQIELAAMRHLGPRIYGMGKVLSRQGGGIGTLGIGETNTELMKRHWRNQMKKVQDKLKKLAADRERQLNRREKMGLQTVSIVGYTNAGKTSLFNKVTRKRNVVDNALFVTLDSSVGKIRLPESNREILVSDTIGFIKNLPTELIDAFKSTLMESVHADLLLHVIDASDQDMERKITSVQQVIWDLGLQHKKNIYVFNKIDVMNGTSKEAIRKQYSYFSPLFISVKKEQGLTELLKVIEETLLQPAITISERPHMKRIHIEEY